MTGWTRAFVGWLGLTVLAGCAGQNRPAPTAGMATSQKTIVIGATALDPEDLTIGASEVVGFVSTAGDPLQVEFVRPKVQTGKITCRLTDPKRLEPGHAPWAEFRTNEEGHLAADVPAGRFPSTCTFAPGFYAYTVKVMNAQRALDQKLGQMGTITVK